MCSFIVLMSLVHILQRSVRTFDWYCTWVCILYYLKKNTQVQSLCILHAVWPAFLWLGSESKPRTGNFSVTSSVNLYLQSVWFQLRRDCRFMVCYFLEGVFIQQETLWILWPQFIIFIFFIFSNHFPHVWNACIYVNMPWCPNVIVVLV